jgi:hypothetical protein
MEHTSNILRGCGNVEAIYSQETNDRDTIIYTVLAKFILKYIQDFESVVDLQTTKGKYKYYSYLLSSRQSQRRKNRHRHNQYD